MEKTKKPWWVKLISAIVGIIIFVALVLVGIWAFFKIKYDVNLINTISQVKAVNTEVNESEKFPNAYNITDMEAAKIALNAKSADLVTGNAIDGYTIRTGSGLNALTGNVMLTDKQIAAIINNLMHEEGNSASVQIGDKSLQMELIQVSFIEIKDNSTDINIVIKLNTKEIKDSMSGFPLSMVSKYVPETLYFSSTVTVKKLEGQFNYEITSKELAINNLTVDETREFVKVLNIALHCGTADELNLSLGAPFVNALIGNENNDGFTYSLKGLGATDFDFISVMGLNYYVIKIAG